jgi:hypothetical protein
VAADEDMRWNSEYRECDDGISRHLKKKKSQFTSSSSSSRSSSLSSHFFLVHLLKSDVLGVLMEALTAHVETVLADQTVTIATSSARARALAKLLGVSIPNVTETHFVSF